MSIIINLLLFILILTVIVSIHEFGHFIFAKICGVYVYEFAIGMGPKIWGTKKGETEYTIRAIPIGGFCQLAGEDLDTDDDKKVPKSKRLQNKKPWQRFLIMFFGPMNNFILAVLILFFSALMFGGSTMEPVITSVEEGSAAWLGGFVSGDRIVEVNGHKITTNDDVSLYLALSNPEDGTEFKVEREDGTVKTLDIKPEKIVDEENKKNVSYKYGIALEQEKTKGFVDSIVYTFKKTCSVFKQMFVTVGALFTGGVSVTQLSGPVGIYSIVGQSRASGIANILYLTAFLSINVGFINLLPIPAFDGGHILFILIEIIKGSPVKPEIENRIHAVFLILLMVLMLFITFNDILRLF